MADDAEPITDGVAALYNRVAAEYGQIGPPVFNYFGRRLVELAGVAEGARVLDVAAGRGAVLFPAAARAGSAGRIVGIDLAEALEWLHPLRQPDGFHERWRIRCVTGRRLAR